MLCVLRASAIFTNFHPTMREGIRARAQLPFEITQHILELCQNLANFVTTEKLQLQSTTDRTCYLTSSQPRAVALRNLRKAGGPDRGHFGRTRTSALAGFRSGLEIGIQAL